MKRLLSCLESGTAGPLALCWLWLALAGAYLCFAVQAHEAMSTKLPRSGFRIPLTRNIPVGNVRLQEIINDLAEKHDATAAQLELAIQSAARTNLIVHLSAAFLSLCGFGSKLCRIRWNLGAHDDPPQEERALARARRARPSETPSIHEGSFPEGGYTV